MHSTFLSIPYPNGQASNRPNSTLPLKTEPHTMGISVKQQKHNRNGHRVLLRVEALDSVAGRTVVSF